MKYAQLFLSSTMIIICKGTLFLKWILNQTKSITSLKYSEAMAQNGVEWAIQSSRGWLCMEK